jgi:hypothetical protein
MPSTIAEVDKLFAAGAESVTLARAEWEAIQILSKAYIANGVDVANTRREIERVKRISRPVWRASRIVSAQVQRAMEYATSAKGHVALSKVLGDAPAPLDGRELVGPAGESSETDGRLGRHGNSCLRTKGNP